MFAECKCGVVSLAAVTQVSEPDIKVMDWIAPRFEGSSLCMPTGLSHQTGRHFRSCHFWIPLFQILGLPNICS